MAEIPADFDWIAYRSLNNDLRFITNQKDAVKHYKTHGFRQNRRYSFTDTGESTDTVHVPAPISASVPVSASAPVVVIDQKRVINDVKTAIYQNQLNQIPEDFDWIAYKALNEDLKGLKSYGDAVRHYREHGYYQKRPYRFEKTAISPLGNSHMPYDMKTSLDIDFKINQLLEISQINYQQLNKMYHVPDNFDWLVYKSCNPDLTGIKTYQDAVKHYLEHGFREQRKFSNDTIPIEPPKSKDPSPAPEPAPAPLKLEEPEQEPEHEPPHEPSLEPEHPPPPEPEPSQESVPNPLNLTELPRDFDWIAYKTINPDLHHLMSSMDAIKHYLEHGRKDNRPYKRPAVGPLLTQEDLKMEKVVSDHDGIEYRPKNLKGIPSVPSVTDRTKIPPDFDWKAYKLYNHDLIGINSQNDAIRHYLEHGYREGRQYTIKLTSPAPSTSVTHETPIDHKEIQLPTDFNWIYYKTNNPDLTGSIKTEQEAIQHYLEHGHREGRPYKPDLQQLEDDHIHIDTRPRPRIPYHKDGHGHDHVSHRSHRHQFPRPPKSVQVQAQTPISVPVPMHVPMIPNIIHFVYGFKKPEIPFELFKYIAIISAYRLNHPKVIYFHYQYEPYGPWWDRIKPYLTMKQIVPPETIYNRKVNSYAHKADWSD